MTHRTNRSRQQPSVPGSRHYCRQHPEKINEFLSALEENEPLPSGETFLSLYRDVFKIPEKTKPPTVRSRLSDFLDYLISQGLVNRHGRMIHEICITEKGKEHITK